MFNRHKKGEKSVNLTDFYSEELKNNAEKVLKQRISSLKAESGKENSSKLSESEITKALEICITKGASCSTCPAFVKVDKSRCKEFLAGAFDLIDRKNAALAEKDAKIDALIAGQETLQKYIAKARAEAIKEFAERVIKEGEKNVDYYTPEGCDNYFRNGTSCGYVVMKNTIEQITAEMEVEL